MHTRPQPADFMKPMTLKHQLVQVVRKHGPAKKTREMLLLSLKMIYKHTLETHQKNKLSFFDSKRYQHMA